MLEGEDSNSLDRLWLAAREAKETLLMMKEDERSRHMRIQDLIAKEKEIARIERQLMMEDSNQLSLKRRLNSS